MNDNQPIIVGIGQTVDRWDGVLAQEAPSPLSLITKASQAALLDTGVEELSKFIDYIAVIRLFSDSLPEKFLPFGQTENYPDALAVSLVPSRLQKYIPLSVGNSHNCLSMNWHDASAISQGEQKLGMIAGGEAIGAMKMAIKRHHKLDWSNSSSGDFEDRGSRTDFISNYEVSNGLAMPPQTYACLETALRNRLGLGKTEYLHSISKMFANFSEVASDNCFSQFLVKRSSEFLSTASTENYPICEPYLKWHVAQDAVNQGASLIMTTVGFAKQLKIDSSKWVYLHGHALGEDKPVSERPDLSRSLALELTINHCLDASNLSAGDVKHRDIYSCFPVVPYLAAEILELNPLEDALTITGGLPFFGGPGNNYSTHAIASMVERLRNNAGDYGLVVANGGFLSKLATGIYSTRPPKNWRVFKPEKIQQTIQEQTPVNLLSKSGEATISAYGIRHSRTGIGHCYAVAENQEGRYFAKVNSVHKTTMSTMAKVEDLLGKTISIVGHDSGNIIMNNNQTPKSDNRNESEPVTQLANNLSLRNVYKHVKLSCNEHVLEVTLDRPESYNALFSEAHFELAEIFDAFEQDKELWVAIITGSGGKAFCSGNDLKVTAKGGDMSIPTSGFAGLCSRTNREKPIIVAVNGVAFGGGLEIVLAADLAIADQHAKFALPEVKVGLFAGAGGLQRLTKQIGRKAAMELILTARAISAEEAKDLGIINSVAEHRRSALDHARELAATIVANSPSAIRASKRLLNEVDRIDDFSETLKLSVPEFKMLLQTKDSREGVSSFVEKRKPKWVNEYAAQHSQ